MPAIEDVERITPLTYSAMRVSPQYVDAIFGLIQAAQEQKRWKGTATPVDLEDGTVGWQVEVLYPSKDQPICAHPGYWLVPDSDLDVDVLKPHEAVAKYHKDVPFEWAGVDAAPTATLNDDGTVKLRFRQPKSINGPFTYAVTRTDSTDSTTAELDPLAEPTVEPVTDSTFRFVGADIYFDVPGGMTSGHLYRFAVTATDGYGKTAVTPETDAITLPEVEEG